MSPSNNRQISPANPTQEYNGVKEKLNELVPRLEELLATLAKANPNSDREEVERRSQLEKSASYPEILARPELTLW